ncbi:MAG: GTPase domain-containing protein [Myxococcota bacterium]
MTYINHLSKEINCKIVYYGPGLCGKTTNLEHIFAASAADRKGKLISLATETDRTLFFDFLPLELGSVGGFKVRFHLYTVPGQVFYDASRKLVLRGADGVVFVADSQPSRSEANIESFENLQVNLSDAGANLADVPHIIQYNKRDLADIMSVEQMRADLNPYGAPEYEASAVTGEGVFETLKGLSKLVLTRIAQAT